MEMYGRGNERPGRRYQQPQRFDSGNGGFDRDDLLKHRD